MQFLVNSLFKNFNNLNLNASGAYLYNSELMLSCPGLLALFINFNAFSSSSSVIEELTRFFE
jgi:hypothetical protein